MGAGASVSSDVIEENIAAYEEETRGALPVERREALHKLGEDLAESQDPYGKLQKLANSSFMGYHEREVIKFVIRRIAKDLAATVLEDAMMNMAAAAEERQQKLEELIAESKRNHK